MPMIGHVRSGGSVNICRERQDLCLQSRTHRRRQADCRFATRSCPSRDHYLKDKATGETSSRSPITRRSNRARSTLQGLLIFIRYGPRLDDHRRQATSSHCASAS